MEKEILENSEPLILDLGLMRTFVDQVESLGAYLLHFNIYYFILREANLEML